MKIAIIPARGGSKRIPRKNIKDFLGKPIIAYSIEAALNSGVFDEVMVSTDDAEIAEVAKKNGAQAPFFRSPELSNDTAMTAPVLIETLKEYEKLGREFKYVCCVYPCAPFTTPERLKEAMGILESRDCDSVLPVMRFSYPPQRCLVVRDGSAQMLRPENYNMRSQDLEPYYHDAGQFYCIKSESLRKEEKLFCGVTLPVILAESEAQDIDTEEDWQIAEIKYQVIKERVKMYKTEQEKFWAGEFGDGYIGRNEGKYMLAENLSFFSKVIGRTARVKSVIEFGANIGSNLEAIKLLLPDCEISGIEINKKAAGILGKTGAKVYNQSILDFDVDYKRDLSFTKGVLIHLNPGELQNVYQKLYDATNKYILIAEYYNTTPVEVPYRGHDEKLFKRDFAGEVMKKFPDLTLLDYGFAYRNDNNWQGLDDITWFLLEKR